MQRSVVTRWGGALIALLALASPCAGRMYETPASTRYASAAISAVEQRQMPRLDNATLVAKAALEDDKVGRPWVFAESISVDLDSATAGTWEVLADGSRLWRLRILSAGAVHLNLGFSRFDVPAGAGLWVYDSERSYVEGPFTARHRSALGRLFTPIIPGDEIVVELHLPAGSADGLDLVVGSVHHGFRGFGFTAVEKYHGSCNNDVICPEGDPWRDQIRSVARYTIGGGSLCSGQLVNNTAEDDTPYFLSAFHCGVSEHNADTLVFYWNYEAPVCGQLDGGSLQDNQTGAIFRASEQISDFLLVELAQPPDPDFDVFFAGWDVSGQVPQGSVCIHHPSGHVKSISFNDDPLGTGTWIEEGTHWLVDNWEDGTTEGGSSGSCLFDPATGLCVGVLTAGLASCEVIDFDIFGKLDLAWTAAGNSTQTRLAPWLDPLGQGATFLPGKDPAGVPSNSCRLSETTMCLRNRRFKVEVGWKDFAGTAGPARIAARPGQSGVFYFFDPDNWELLVKILDGCGLNNHLWLFAAAATNVEYTVRVTDTLTGDTAVYFNPLGNAPVAVTDVAAFPTCQAMPGPTRAVERMVRLDGSDGSELVMAPLPAGGLAELARSPAPTRLLPPARHAPLGALSRSRLPAKDCGISTMACGDRVAEVLEPSDCWFDNGTVIDFWLFAGSGGDTVTIDMESDDFDTFLYLLDDGGDVVATDDDGGAGTNSRITYTLDASGTWTIVANSVVPAEGDYNLSLECTMPAEPPMAPSNLTAMALSSTEVELGWQDNSDNESEFRVEARIRNGAFEDIGAVRANSIGAPVNDLASATRYTFRVRARNAAGDSPYSNEASVTTPIGSSCTSSQINLCLAGGRFRAEVDWQGPAGPADAARVVPVGTDTSGLFRFADADNWEVLVKVIDGCDINNRFWLFAGAATTLGHTVRVTDTVTGEVRQYTSPLGAPSPAVIDTSAFATCGR